jgi:hypothetical protein
MELSEMINWLEQESSCCGVEIFVGQPQGAFVAVWIDDNSLRLVSKYQPSLEEALIKAIEQVKENKR